MRGGKIVDWRDSDYREITQQNLKKVAKITISRSSQDGEIASFRAVSDLSPIHGISGDLNALPQDKCFPPEKEVARRSSLADPDSGQVARSQRFHSTEAGMRHGTRRWHQRYCGAAKK